MTKRLSFFFRIFLVVAVFASSDLSADPAPSPGASFRRFLAELVSATDLSEFSGLNAYQLAEGVSLPPESELKARRALRLRSLFAEHAPLLQSMVDRKTGHSILEAARLEELRPSFESFHEILDLHVFSVVPAEKITSLYRGDGVTRQLVLNEVSDQAWNDLIEALESRLAKIDFSHFAGIKKLGEIELEIPNPEMKKLAQTALGSYFDAEMPFAQKRQILEAVLRLAPEEHSTRLVGTIFANTKILFQKSLQFFADRSTNEEFKRAADAVKSELPGLKDADYLHGMAGVVHPEEMKKFSAINQVAAGTTAVGAIFKHTEHSQVFTKLLRPGIEMDIEADYQRFRALLGNDPGALEMLNSVADGVRLEISTRREAFNFIVANAIFNPSDENASKVRIPKVFHDIAPANDRLIVLEIAPGKPVARMELARLSSRELAQLARGYESMLEQWFSQTYGLNQSSTGFTPSQTKAIQQAATDYLGRRLSKKEFAGVANLFHGDLHGGNVFVDPTDFARPGVPGGYWIDWGNAHALTGQQRAGQLKSVLGSALRDLGMIQGGLEAVVRFSAKSRSLFRSEMSKYLAGAGATAPPDQVLNRSISIALQSGVGLPEAVVNAGRGQGMLINQLNTIRSELGRRKALGRYGLRPPADVLIETIRNHLKKDLLAQTFSAEARRTATISLRTVWDVATIYAKNFIRQTCPKWLVPEEKSILRSTAWMKPIRARSRR